MSRIATPATADAPAASQPLLDGVKSQLGVVPNLFRVISNSPAALQGHLNLHGALSKGTLSAATRERIAIAVAELDGCDYCLSAHSYFGKNLLKLDDAELWHISKIASASWPAAISALAASRNGILDTHQTRSLPSRRTS